MTRQQHEDMIAAQQMLGLISDTEDEIYDEECLREALDMCRSSENESHFSVIPVPDQIEPKSDQIEPKSDQNERARGWTGVLANPPVSYEDFDGEAFLNLWVSHCHADYAVG